MQNHLTDLDELLEGVRNDRSREYISEAISTYRAGAYRSAIIATWVAVCIDIIDKIRELSLEGDKRAKNLETRLDKLKDTSIKDFQIYENSLLEYAQKNILIISSHESVLLQRIKDDRNFCAHPDFINDAQGEQITAEGARAHIVNACNILLHHTPIRGKILIKRIEKLVAEISFSPDEETAYIVLSSEHYLNFGRAQDSVFRNLTAIFLKNIFKGNRFSYSRIERLSSALQAISKLKSDVYGNTLKERLDSQLSDMTDARLKRIFLLPHLWSRIGNPIQKRIIELVLTLPPNDIIKYKLNLSAEKIPAIKSALITRFESFEDNNKLKVIAGCPIKEFKTLAIQTFIASGNYNIAHTNGQQYLLPYAPYFDRDDLQNILNESRENSQILPARGMEEIFISFFNETKQTIPEYGDMWLEFWNAIRPRYGQSLNVLSAHLTAEGIIPAPPAPDDDT